MTALAQQLVSVVTRADSAPFQMFSGGDMHFWCGRKLDHGVLTEVARVSRMTGKRDDAVGRFTRSECDHHDVRSLETDSQARGRKPYEDGDAADETRSLCLVTCPRGINEHHPPIGLLAHATWPRRWGDVRKWTRADHSTTTTTTTQQTDAPRACTLDITTHPLVPVDTHGTRVPERGGCGWLTNRPNLYHVSH